MEKNYLSTLKMEKAISMKTLRLVWQLSKNYVNNSLNSSIIIKTNSIELPYYLPTQLTHMQEIQEKQLMVVRLAGVL